MISAAPNIKPSLRGVSIVTPVFNEQDNIRLLVERISRAMISAGIDYEIVFIDDHSTDGTVAQIKQLMHQYPIRLHSKIGQRGKAQSLLQGFAQSRYNLIAMIDGDLQYPPEMIPKMAKKIIMGKTHVVVAERSEHQEGLAREKISKAFRFIFAKLLHNMDVDVQSGLKVFRREIIDRVKLNPTPWTFDLEFLLLARSAGYRISSVPIVFSQRHSGASKVNIAKTIIEIGWSAVKLKIKELRTIPFHKNIINKIGYGFHYKGRPFVPHTSLPISNSAFITASSRQKRILLGLALLLAAALLANWHAALIFFLGIVTILYFSDLLFYMFLILKSMQGENHIDITYEQLKQNRTAPWPTYTILCPLYKEWRVLPQFIRATMAIDYPKDKLQVAILLEEDDKKTIAEVKKMKLPAYFDVIVVPNSQPKTKPKACNYGLKFATGEYTVIYDAEDIPDPLQLKKAVIAFENSAESTVCLQSKLNFYNPQQNLLTKLFTAEYSLWFDLILPGLQGIDAPIPLGGTSNHFKSAFLNKVKGWDAFNVTEDCDLGMRVATSGYRTAIINSTTYEEANSDYKNWFWQRTRWVKGYLQTYLVHMRDPSAFIQATKNKQFAFFQLVVGGKAFLSLVNPFMWAITIVYFAARSTYGPLIESLFPTYIFYIGLFSAVVGNFLYFYYYMIGCAKRQQYQLIPYMFLVPFYWLYMSTASWVAAVLLVVKPHHWSKTKHGLHLLKAKTINKKIIPSTQSQPRYPLRPAPSPVRI
jgi:glycosyltransferase XagB